MPVNILMISGNCPPISCGIGDYTARLIPSLQKQADAEKLKISWLSRKERWFSLPYSKSRGISISKPWHKWEERGTRLAKAYLQWKAPQITHLQEEFYSYMEGDASVQLAKAGRSPLVVTLHAYHEEGHIQKQTQSIIDLADQVICSDQRTTDRLLLHTGRKADLTGWCSSPVTPRFIAKEHEALEPCFGTFGFVHPGKMNFEVVHKAMERVNAKIVRSEWKIIGPMNPKENQDHKELLQKMKDPWVEFTGKVDDLREESFHRRISRLTAMLLPFRNRTGSNGTAPSRSSLQLAWAFGLPVIASSPLEEEPALRDGENCLLVDEDDPDAWSAALESILNDHSLRKSLREGSLATANEFSWDRLAKEHLRIYKKVSN